MANQDEPVFGLSYGDSGTGKTADALFAFPDGEILCPRGSAKSTRNLHGFEPRIYVVKTIDDSIARLRWWKTQKARPSGFILDDASLQQQAQLLMMKSKNYESWRLILEKLLEFTALCREMDAHTWMTAHEMAPRTFSGQWYRGGPMLAGQASQHLPKSTDICLRVTSEENRPMWRFAYQCNNVDENYVTKDRTNTCPDVVPMNIAEILRAAGYAIPRKHGLEWQESMVQRITDALLKTEVEKRKAVIAKAASQLSTKGYNDMHIAWVLRDAVDRAVLVTSKNNPLRRMMSTFK